MAVSCFLSSTQHPTGAADVLRTDRRTKRPKPSKIEARGLQNRAKMAPGGLGGGPEPGGCGIPLVCGPCWAQLWAAFGVPKLLKSVLKSTPKIRRHWKSLLEPPGLLLGSRGNGPWQNQFRLGVAQIHPKFVEKHACVLNFEAPGSKRRESDFTF